VEGDGGGPFVRYCLGLAARKKPERRKDPDPVRAPGSVRALRSGAGASLAAGSQDFQTLEDVTQQRLKIDAPEIVIGRAPMGRETLSAIEEELAESVGRAPQATLPYGDRISNAPGAKAPHNALASAPEIVVSQAPAGRSTLSAIEEELRVREASAPSIEIVDSCAEEERIPEDFEVFEMATFIVRGRDIARLSSEALRRRFVEEHLLHRLPAHSMDGVGRVEVTPWTVRGTVVVRVWCRIPPGSA
jgi:hypothetical protein